MMSNNFLNDRILFLVAKINEIGSTDSCHTRATTDPGTKSEDFITDHQPPSELVPAGTMKES